MHLYSHQSASSYKPLVTLLVVLCRSPRSFYNIKPPAMPSPTFFLGVEKAQLAHYIRDLQVAAVQNATQYNKDARAIAISTTNLLLLLALFLSTVTYGEILEKDVGR